MIRFPQAETKEINLITFNNVPFAKWNSLQKSTGVQVGFLTESTVFFILKGEKHIHFEHHKVTAKEGDVLMLRRGIYTISESIPRSGSFEALMVFLPVKLLRKMDSYIGSFRPKKQESPIVVFKGNNLLNSFKDQYLTYFQNSFSGLQKVFELKIEELCLLLVAGPEIEKSKRFLGSIVYSERIDIEHVVRTNLFQPLSLQEFATLSGRSLASFKRDFTKKFKLSPRQWINKKRLTHARMLLSASGKTASEIALECGYESVSHFIKIFKREFGMTPQAFRAKRTIK